MKDKLIAEGLANAAVQEEKENGTSPSGEASYKSSFKTWDRAAWIKKSPQEFFSAKLFRAADHHLVTAQGPEVRSALLTKRLFAYARFTAVLERHVVNPITLLIADNRLSLDLAAGMRADADRIYTDEAWHAQESNQIIAQVSAASGLIPVEFEPDAIGQYLRILDSQAPEMKLVAQLLFGIVSETLISSILNDIPRDYSVHGVVRDYVDEHAKDERRHHAFFSDVLKYSWPQLSELQKSTVGPLIPRFMKLFLQPDVPSIQADLLSLRFSHEQVQQIVDQAVVTPASLEAIRASTQRAIGYFREAGALEIASVRDAFENEGLL